MVDLCFIAYPLATCLLMSPLMHAIAWASTTSLYVQDKSRTWARPGWACMKEWRWGPGRRDQGEALAAEIYLFIPTYLAPNVTEAERPFYDRSQRWFLHVIRRLRTALSVSFSAILSCEILGFGQQLSVCVRAKQLISYLVSCGFRTIN